MSELLVQVVPNFETLKWELLLNDIVLGVSKASCDVDCAAEKLRNLFEEPQVLKIDHHSEERQELMAKMAELKKDSKNKQRNVA